MDETRSTESYTRDPRTEVVPPDFPYRVPYDLHVDGSLVHWCRFLGRGVDGIVYQTSKDAVVKLPNLTGYILEDGSIELPEDFEWEKRNLDNEKIIYGHIRGLPHIAECLGTSEYGITLRYYDGGSLDCLMESTEKTPTIQLRCKWIMQVVLAIAECHNVRVLVYDIALRNLMLDDNQDIKMIDFANSTYFAADRELGYPPCENGVTVKLDLLNLGAVLYSIAIWRPFTFDCTGDADWPALQDLPSTKGLPFGNIVRRCWTRQYDNIQQLRAHLQNPRARRKSKRQWHKNDQDRGISSKTE